MQTLPTIESYGDYSSSNYGVNSLCVTFPNGLTLWYSYKTIIAFRESYGQAVVIRENDWSTTTGKHLNWIDADKSKRIKGEAFESALQAMLTAKGLAQ